MWARYIELICAVWLGLSSFVLDYPIDETFLKTNNLICASLIALFALLSFCHCCRKMHLLTLVVALWLWGLSYLSFPQIASFPLEHSAMTGVLLFMLAIVPSRTAQLSPSWHDYYSSNF